MYFQTSKPFRWSPGKVYAIKKESYQFYRFKTFYSQHYTTDQARLDCHYKMLCSLTFTSLFSSQKDLILNFSIFIKPPESFQDSRASISKDKENYETRWGGEDDQCWGLFYDCIQVKYLPPILLLVVIVSTSSVPNQNFLLFDWAQNLISYIFRTNICMRFDFPALKRSWI